LIIAPTLHSMAEMLMQQMVESLTALLLPVPERRVIYAGQIPADCEQLAVVIGGWSASPPQDGMVTCMTYRWAGDFTVLLTRGCAPAMSKRGGAPSAAAMGEVAYTASNDAEAMLDLVRNIGEHGGTVTITATAPSGGLHSTILEILLPAAD
jgi:hypothetical protein